VYSEREKVLSSTKQQQEAAAANESAKKAEASAAEAKLELERLKAPRRLTDTQAQEMSGELKRFSGQEFELSTALGGAEPTALSNQIFPILTGAHWKYVEPHGYRYVIGGDGVLVAIQPDADSKTRDASLTLVKALTSHGIASMLTTDSTTLPNRVRVQVSDKPINTKP
jgi:hypothetical protein